jgi:hypothetical protein
MTAKTDTLKEEDRGQKESPKREEALNALRRLRDIGERLPAVDALLLSPARA